MDSVEDTILFQAGSNMLGGRLAAIAQGQQCDGTLDHSQSLVMTCAQASSDLLRMLPRPSGVPAIMYEWRVHHAVAWTGDGT